MLGSVAHVEKHRDDLAFYLQLQLQQQKAAQLERELKNYEPINSYEGWSYW
jgi:hypothetical protein